MSGDVFLHEIVKALFVYRREVVFKRLANMYPDWGAVAGRRDLPISKRELIAVRPEAGLSRYLDVAWIVKGFNIKKYIATVGNVTRNFCHVIGFEIKTGEMREEWFEQMRGLIDQRDKVQRLMLRLGRCREIDAGTMYYVFVVKRRYVEEVEERAKKIWYRSKAIPLEPWISMAIPFLEEALEKAKKMTGRDKQ